MRISCITLLALAAFSIPAAAQPPADLPLAVRGREAEYSIVIPSEASPSQRYAAEELRDFSERMTGVRLPIVTDADPLPEKAILLGETRHTPSLLSGQVQSSAGKMPASPGTAKPSNCQTVKPAEACGLGPDGFRLVARPPHLLVVGAPRGTLYGVYEMLERFAGCRWYSSWHSVVPSLERFSVPGDLEDTQTPAFEMREPYWFDVMANPDFAARLRVNGYHHNYHAGVTSNLIARNGGDSFRFGRGLGTSHTFATLIPPEKYYDKHPEYFSMVNGRRLKDKSQLCLTNPEVLEIVTSNVLERAGREPQAKYFGVSQNDWGNWCECPDCRAVDEEEGSHAGTIVRFVNAVAEAVEKKFPDVVIETLAYQYSRTPPGKTRPRKNVLVCLCTYSCDFSSPIPESRYGDNASFMKDVAGWARQTGRLYLWDYTTDFNNYPMPFANVYALQGNLKFFRDNGVKMLFSQGDNQGRLGDFGELKAWLVAKWMWNPDLPMEPLLNDFLNGYYGKAAPFVRRYLDELHERQRRHGNPLLIYDDVFNPALSDEFLCWAADLWRLAEETVKDDPATAYNVRMGAFSVAFMRFERMRHKLEKNPPRQERGGSAAADDLALAKAMCKSLLERMEEAKCVRIAESNLRNDRILKAWRELLAKGEMDRQVQAE